MTNSACKIRSLSASWWMQLVVEFNRRYSLTQAGRPGVQKRRHFFSLAVKIGQESVLLKFRFPNEQEQSLTLKSAKEIEHFVIVIITWVSVFTNINNT